MSAGGVDDAELRRLVADIAKASPEVKRLVRVSLRQSAGRIKDGLATEFGDIKGMPGLGRKAAFTVRGLSAEIGFNKGGVGNLANIAAFGGSRGGPYRDLNRPLEQEGPQFERAIGTLAERVLSSRGEARFGRYGL